MRASTADTRSCILTLELRRFHGYCHQPSQDTSTNMGIYLHFRRTKENDNNGKKKIVTREEKWESYRIVFGVKLPLNPIEWQTHWIKLYCLQNKLLLCWYYVSYTIEEGLGSRSLNRIPKSTQLKVMGRNDYHVQWM